MPNINTPHERVRTRYLSEDSDLVENLISAGIHSHEAEYLKKKYRYEEIEYSAREAFPHPSFQAERFLVRNYWKAKKKAALEIGAHVVIAILTLFFVL